MGLVGKCGILSTEVVNMKLGRGSLTAGDSCDLVSADIVVTTEGRVVKNRFGRDLKIVVIPAKSTVRYPDEGGLPYLVPTE